MGFKLCSLFVGVDGWEVKVDDVIPNDRHDDSKKPGVI